MTDVTEELLLRSQQVQRLSGASYRQLDYWARHGVLEPAVAARGSGTNRLYYPADAEIAKRLVELSEIIEFTSNSGVGVPSGLARRIVEAMRADPSAEWVEVGTDGVVLKVRGLAGG